MPLRMPMNITNFTPDFSAGFSPLMSLVYVSASTHLLSNAELEEILTVSRSNNSELGLTGMLLYYDGALMQALEGPEQVVYQMYERIGRDPRHHNLSVLLEEYIPERNFPDWSMGYQRIAAGTLDNLEGFPTFAGADPFLRYFQATPQKSMILLQTIGKTPHP